jgi:hypothetical protein
MATNDNRARYKAGFTNNATKKDFVKHTPFRFVNGLSDTQLAALEMRRESYPTPVYPGGDGRGK